MICNYFKILKNNTFDPLPPNQWPTKSVVTTSFNYPRDLECFRFFDIVKFLLLRLNTVFFFNFLKVKYIIFNFITIIFYRKWYYSQCSRSSGTKWVLYREIINCRKQVAIFQVIKRDFKCYVCIMKWSKC